MYSRFEKGERKPKMEQLDVLAVFLKVDLKELHILWLADRIANVVGESPKEVTSMAIELITNKL